MKFANAVQTGFVAVLGSVGGGVELRVDRSHKFHIIIKCIAGIPIRYGNADDIDKVFAVQAKTLHFCHAFRGKTKLQPSCVAVQRDVNPVLRPTFG